MPLLPSVDANEVAFAMDLFFAAASGRMHAPDLGISGTPLREDRDEFLDEGFALEDDAGITQDTSQQSVPLSRALAVLWNHYRGDDRQRVIWSRVVAFNAMMFRSMVAAGGKEAPLLPESDRAVSLGPAVIHAVAVAPLTEFGQFSVSNFQELVDQFKAEPAHRSGPPSPISQEMPAFRTLERLWRPFESFSGKRGFQSLLARALAASSTEYPWLRSVQLKPDGFLEGPGMYSPDPKQAAAGELAVMRSLVAMLQTIVGHSVTLRLIENVCPEALSETWDNGSGVATKPEVKFSNSPGRPLSA